MSDTIVFVQVQSPDKIEVSTSNNIDYTLSLINPTPLQISVSPQAGLPGIKGDTGLGILPLGGLTGQALKKLGNADNQVGWVTDDIPHGLDMEIQFNDNGIVGSDANFLYDKDKESMSVGKPLILPNAPIAAGGDVDGYIQVTVQNRNNGIDASSDFVATADNGDDTNNYIDLGINGSNYNDPDFNVTNANDSYLLSIGGDLVIGTDKDKIKLFVGDSTVGSIIGNITNSGLDMINGAKVSENGFNLSDMIIECNNATAESIAFSNGSLIVIRTDLL